MRIDRNFVFPRWANYIPLFLIVLGLGGAAGAHVVFGAFANPKFYEAGYEPTQPVPFSHKLHVGELGMECLYCHTGAEKSSVAGIPATSVCMKCHTSIKPDSPKLRALRKSVEQDEALEWIKVHRLPDYVHFPHKAHVQAGLDCQTCHGPIERMEKVRIFSPMSMGWCLNCHRNPNPTGLDVDIPTHKMHSWEEVADNHPIFETSTRERSDVQPPTNCSGCHQ